METPFTRLPPEILLLVLDRFRQCASRHDLVSLACTSEAVYLETVPLLYDGVVLREDRIERVLPLDGWGGDGRGKVCPRGSFDVAAIPPVPSKKGCVPDKELLQAFQKANAQNALHISTRHLLPLRYTTSLIISAPSSLLPHLPTSPRGRMTFLPSMEWLIYPPSLGLSTQNLSWSETYLQATISLRQHAQPKHLCFTQGPGKWHFGLEHLYQSFDDPLVGGAGQEGEEGGVTVEHVVGHGIRLAGMGVVGLFRARVVELFLKPERGVSVEKGGEEGEEHTEGIVKFVEEMLSDKSGLQPSSRPTISQTIRSLQFHNTQTTLGRIVQWLGEDRKVKRSFNEWVAGGGELIVSGTGGRGGIRCGGCGRSE
ncbi:hypothetical protein I350_03939 [Cryptococcus amylolentus CBS 6273]|uniref:Uncharacterized protein n=1 Tax=Cryptococcus amylolentus CBS 6273 TaxID=1296118 RepID=A0A1E3K0Q5_9TREE|nr:hypothetical protein I350_03939 [Cryptococcus amylolentus CBS 6273]